MVKGEIGAETSVLDVLREVEDRRTSGVLKFVDGEASGEVALVAGLPAEDQKKLADGSDPVEKLLALQKGSYEVWQKLPPLPVSHGDDVKRNGSLAVHVPADLMNYCERAGLTGTLFFENAGRKAEAMYDRGELVAIRVDGGDEALNEVFSWEEGTFQIVAEATAPSVDVILINAEELPYEEPEITIEEQSAAKQLPSDKGPPPRRRRFRTLDETGKQFLNVVEVALSSIVEQREKRRSPSRSSPPLPAAPAARKTESARPAAKKSERPPTVRIVYLEGGVPVAAGPSTTRHVSTGRQETEKITTDARPERLSTKNEALPESVVENAIAKPADPVSAARKAAASAPTIDVRRPDVGSKGMIALWVLVAISLVLAAVALLAPLPMLE